MRLFLPLIRRFPGWLMLGIVLAACSSTSAAPPGAQSSVAPSASPTPSFFQTNTRTSDGKFLVQLTITPNRFGPNLFIIGLRDASTGESVVDEHVQIFTTMLDMDMAKGVVILEPDGKGNYSSRSTFPMDGNWDVHIQVLDDTPHIAKLKLFIPA